MSRVLAMGIALIVVAVAILGIFAVLDVMTFAAMRTATARVVGVLVIALAAALAVGGLVRATRPK